MGQRSRRRVRSTAARTSTAAPPRPRPRGEAKEAEARAALEPLREGERPRVVTVAAVVAALLIPANVVASLTVHLSSSSKSAPAFTAIQCLVLAAAAIGMWRVRYWAVLGFQALLALQILSLALALTRVGNVLVGLGVAVLIGAMGYLFWKLVRAMARIQMPERPRRA